MERIVHLDFKGAPLKVSYLEKVFSCIKAWGGTGVLIEWEDTFPFTADLDHIGSLRNCGGDQMYSHEEVKDIILCAKAKGLEVIQLIQTIAHMEYVLKHQKYQYLKEFLPSPAVLCPSKPESLRLVCDMVQQVLDAQPEAKYIHIGADEVWHIAVCRTCQHKAAMHKYKVASLFLDHIQGVILYVKTRRPNITILMWDDMLRPMTLETLQAYNLHHLVQPVIWNYSGMENFQIDRTLWAKYENLFSSVWAGSAFKGANGSSQMLSRVGRYVSNQEAWLKEISNKPNGINFNGVILTGWSRYDHYATLCELFPVALPSLFSCLRTWTHPTENNEAREVLPEEDWPGIELARCIHSFVMLRERSYSLLHGDLVATWLNPWQVKASYTSPVQVESVANASQTILTDLKGLYAETKKQLEQITGKRSTEEWIVSFFDNILKNIEELHRVASLRRQVGASIGPNYQ